MKNTTNYLLNKPDFTDFADIKKINDNFDTIDTKIKEVDEKAGNIDLSSLQTQIDKKSEIDHKHAISDVTNLQTTLNEKASSSHTHTIANVTGLQTTLDSKASNEVVNAHINSKSNPHDVTSEQVNIIAPKSYFALASSYPKGVSIFGLTATEANSWLQRADSTKPTDEAFAMVTTFIGNSLASLRALQRVTFVTSSANTTYGTFEREGVNGIWQLFKKVLNSSDVVNDLVTEDAKKPLSASQGKVLNKSLNTHLGDNVSHISASERTTWNGKLDATANAASATKLATRRSIDGINFDGTENIVNYATCMIGAATTTKTATLSTFNLITGARISIKFLFSNSVSDPTLNINYTGAKALRKSNGSPFDKWSAGGVYTFIYDGMSFIVQGEGGEYGTATASDVRTGKTFGTEDGVVNGALNLTNLIPENIKSGVTIDGKTGVLPALIAGTFLLWDEGTRNFNASSSTTSYARAVRFKILAPGTYRLQFSFRSSDPNQTCHAKVYRNGSPISGEYTNTGYNRQAVIYDFTTMNPNDTIEIWTRNYAIPPQSTIYIDYVTIKTGTLGFETLVQ